MAFLSEQRQATVNGISSSKSHSANAGKEGKVEKP